MLGGSGMKMKEFVRQVEALGYEVSYSWGTIYIKRAGFAILELDYVEEWYIDTDYPGFDEMRWDDKKELMTIVSEYMLTDPKDREEEKRYRLLSVSPMLRKSECGYLLYHKSMGRYFTGSAEYGGDVYQAIFTESEIAQMDITGFEKIEVSND